MCIIELSLELHLNHPSVVLGAVATPAAQGSSAAGVGATNISHFP